MGVAFNIGVGSWALHLNGGEISYDGLPVFLIGPISAGLLVPLYWAGTTEFFSPAPAQAAPGAKPSGRLAG